ncbi:unnamed protein product [Gongylonema pulchrum]|uniref:Bromo domain-containing protein n=1 Tax=Gongylonema pulchrum TaxID=637853 RepID=A0A183EBK5_9BILA|nr:unnamed protein product [Gongylonema pulchrum]
MAPNFQFAPTDFDPDLLKSHEGLHGLGYQAIQSTSVLSEKYGTIEAALKTRAFGVGAFEDDDESIYTNYDFSQYDFSIGPGGKAAYASCSASDTSFIMAEKRQPARQFFEPPRLPTNFRPIHTPIHPDISRMPANIKQFGEKMNHLQRAKLLGEVDPKAVLELIHDKDRKRLTASASRTSMNSEDLLKNAFEEEPMKQARFKQYVHYLKRGLSFPRPSDLTTLEWEQELSDFQNILPPELRSLLPEVRMRQKPLVRIDIAAPIADVLKSKFTSSSGASSSSKMFGEKTRSAHEWHPAKQLAKRFNVPDPYPSSTLLGVPHLQKATKTETLANLGANVLPVGSTAQELEYRADIEKRESERKKEISKEEKQDDKTPADTTEKASEEFLKAIFGGSDDSDTDDSDVTEDDERNNDQDTALPASKDLSDDKTAREVASETVATEEKVITIMDIPLKEDENEQFGPALPPTLSNESKPYVAVKTERKFRFTWMDICFFVTM